MFSFLFNSSLLQSRRRHVYSKAAVDKLREMRREKGSTAAVSVSQDIGGGSQVVPRERAEIDAIKRRVGVAIECYEKNTGGGIGGTSFDGEDDDAPPSRRLANIHQQLKHMDQQIILFLQRKG